jgi:F-box/WD-40 domain protein MET30
MVSSSHVLSTYVCDTLPAPRFVGQQNLHQDSTSSSSAELGIVPHLESTDKSFDGSLESSSNGETEARSAQDLWPPKTSATPRKLCVRHQRMADEGTNLKLQQVFYFFFLHPNH